MTKEFTCICCGTKISYLDPKDNSKPEIAMINSGIVGKIAAGYGSKADGDMYYIAICDDCVKYEVKMKRLIFAGNYIFPELKEPTKM